jgi:hypothetical protein
MKVHIGNTYRQADYSLIDRKHHDIMNTNLKKLFGLAVQIQVFSFDPEF